MEEMRNQKCFSQKTRRKIGRPKRRWENDISLRWLRKLGLRICAGFNWLNVRSVSGSCEQGMAPQVQQKAKNFLTVSTLTLVEYLFSRKTAACS